LPSAAWGQGIYPPEPNRYAQQQDPKCSWVSKLDTTTDYGVAGGSAQHEVTKGWYEMKEAERAGNVKAEQAAWKPTNPGPHADYPNCAVQK